MNRRLPAALAVLSLIAIMIGAFDWPQLDIGPPVSDDFDPGWGHETKGEYHD